jgi:hypothetical protein
MAEKRILRIPLQKFNDIYDEVNVQIPDKVIIGQMDELDVLH